MNFAKIESPPKDVRHSQKGILVQDGLARWLFLYTSLNVGKLIYAGPAPAFGQFRQRICFRALGLLVLLSPPLRRFLACLSKLGELVLLPLAAALGEDAFEQDRGGFGVGVLCPPLLGELAFDRHLEDRSPI